MLGCGVGRSALAACVLYRSVTVGVTASFRLRNACGMRHRLWPKEAVRLLERVYLLACLQAPLRWVHGLASAPQALQIQC
jgi:hypothetical protein